MDECFHILRNGSDSVVVKLQCLRENVTAERVFDKMHKAKLFGESVSELIYLGVHDAVLAAVERDATLRQQVWSAACYCH